MTESTTPRDFKAGVITSAEVCRRIEARIAGRRRKVAGHRKCLGVVRPILAFTCRSIQTRGCGAPSRLRAGRTLRGH